MANLKREPADAYWSDRAHLEHKARVFQTGLLAMIFVFAASQILWFVMFARVANPVVVHANLDEISTEPINVELQFMAWEVLRPFLTVDSSNVLNDIQASKRFMTERCISAWDRSLAAYEREHGKPYVQAVVELGVQSQFGEVRGERLPNLETDGTTRYVVRLAGARTVLSRARGTGEPRPFEYLVVLERAPRSKTNPIGLLASEIRPAPSPASDGREREGQPVVPYTASAAETPSRRPAE